LRKLALLLARGAGGCYQFCPERQGVCRPARAFHKFIFLPVLFPDRLPKKQLILLRCRIFRGKIPRAKLKTKTHLKTGRIRATKPMNNSNPFVPKGSLLEQQSQRRSRLKLAVFCVLAVSVTCLVAMLIQGCKREKPDTELNPPPLDLTNSIPLDLTNAMTDVSNPPVVLPPITNTMVTPVPTPVDLPPIAPAGSEYTVAKGDTLAVIAKKHGVSLSALQAANPGVVPTKLKIGQKLTIPAGGSAAGASVAPAASVETGGTTYTVKSGDTLTSIAKKQGTTVKAIQSANNLITTKIKVGQKLTIPSKISVPAPVAPAPVSEPAPAPVLPPLPAPAPAQ
jgi:LysM repeat protein